MTVTSSRDLVYRPRWLAEHHADPFCVKHRRPELFASLCDFCERKRPASVCLYRTHALGDILMLLPIVRAFRRRFNLPKPVMLVIAEKYGTQLAGLNRAPWDVRLVPKRGLTDYGADVHFDLNRCLEADHRGGAESDFHRMALYGRAMGMEVRPA